MEMVGFVRAICKANSSEPAQLRTLSAKTPRLQTVEVSRPTAATIAELFGGVGIVASMPTQLWLPFTVLDLSQEIGTLG